jgi:hypothetical protein
MALLYSVVIDVCRTVQVYNIKMHVGWDTLYHYPFNAEIKSLCATLPDEILLLGILFLEPCISSIYAWKTNKYNKYSFSLLIMYGSSTCFGIILPSSGSVSSAFWEMQNSCHTLLDCRFLKRPLLTVSRSFMNVANRVLWRMIILKANKVNSFVSSVLFVFWYHSPNVLDTPHICNISRLRVNISVSYICM